MKKVITSIIFIFLVIRDSSLRAESLFSRSTNIDTSSYAKCINSKQREIESLKREYEDCKNNAKNSRQGDLYRCTYFQNSDQDCLERVKDDINRQTEECQRIYNQRSSDTNLLQCRNEDSSNFHERSIYREPYERIRFHDQKEAKEEVKAKTNDEHSSDFHRHSIYREPFERVNFHDQKETKEEVKPKTNDNPRLKTFSGYIRPRSESFDEEKSCKPLFEKKYQIGTKN